MQETAVENPYGLGALIANGDIIARAILLILLIMSLLTWFIMITKFFDQRRQRKQGVEAEKEFWTSTSLTDALNKLKGTSNPFRALAETGKQAYEYPRDQQDALVRCHRHQRVDHRVPAAHCEHGLQPQAVGPAGARNLPRHRALRRIARYGHRYLSRPDRHLRGRTGIHRQGGRSRRRSLDR